MTYSVNYKRVAKIVACLLSIAVCLQVYHANTDFDLSDGVSFFKKYYQPHSYGMKNLMKFKHTCIHSKIVEIEKSLDQPKQAFDETLRDHEDISGVLPIESDFKTIRIGMDYSNLSGNTAATQKFVQHSIGPAILNYFQDTVKVQRLTQPIKVDPYYKTKNCGAAGIVIPAAHFATGVSGVDLIYYVKTYRENSNTLAYASYCPQGSAYGLSSGRPTVAYMNINLAHLDADLASKDPMILAKWIFVCIHEVTHSFVFSPNYFDNFLLEKNPVVKQDGKTWVVAPSAVKIGQTHFGCPTLKRLPLEDEGGDGTMGAHWERKAFGNELMTGSQMYDSVFSKFTSSIFVASGWYQMNEYMLGTLTWGSNEKCPFVEYSCPKTVGEFCSAEGKRCSYDYTGTGYCSSSDSLSDRCNYWDSYGNTHCNFPDANAGQMFKAAGGNFGAGARCFDTDIAKAVGYSTVSSVCLESRCDYSGSQTLIKFKVSGTEYSCNTSTGTVTIPGKGKVTCPDVMRFCFSPSACANSCTGRGVCRLGKCACYKGFTGDDCSVSNN